MRFPATKLALGALILSLCSCAALLDSEVTAVDPATGQPVVTTLGDAIADNSESFGATAGQAVTTTTGNPLIGLMVAGAASAVAAAARRKKPLIDGVPGDI